MEAIIKTLGTVATYINGRAFKPSEWKTSGKPIIRIQNLTDRSAKYNFSDVEHEKKYLVKNDDLLFAWSASLGAHFWHGQDAWLNQHIFKVIPNDDVDKKYLYYFFLQVVTELYSKTHGSGMVHITKGPFLATKIPVPPLPEQERIVAKIEELFSQLDAAVAELKSVKEKLAIYRQAVLKEAFEKHDDWEKYQLDDLMESVKNGYGKKPTDSGEYRILKISAVRALVLDLDESRLNRFPFGEGDLIHENDLLFTRYNGSRELVGVCAVVPKLSIDYAYPDKIIRCIPKKNSVAHSKFLSYYLNHGEARKFIRSKIKTTSGQNGISGSDLKRTEIYLPNAEIQENIVSQIEEKLSVCNDIEQTVDTALQQAATLRQSILKQAFEGNL